MKPLCVLLDNVGSDAAERLSTVLRDLSERIGARSMEERPLREMRRFADAMPDEGTGIQWTSGRYRAHSYAWATPEEFEVSVTTPGRKQIRLRMPMPEDPFVLEDVDRLSPYLASLANLVDAAISMRDERAEHLIARLDALSQAAGAVASTLIRGRFHQAVRIEAPSPFAKSVRGFAHDGGEILLTTTGFREMIEAELPTMVQVKRNNTRDLHFTMDAMGCFVDAQPRSANELLRQVAPFGPDPLPMVEWSNSQRT